MAAALSADYGSKSGVSLCGSMLNTEYRRVTAELTKKVQKKESVISKRKSKEEKVARTHKKCENKENNKERSEIKHNNRHTHSSALKELYGKMTADKQHERKRTKDANELELIWHKSDITRMRDSEISLQMENMRKYAETETRGIVDRKTKLGFVELERLEDIDRQRELTQLTYLRAKAGRDVPQNDVMNKQVTLDFSSEVDDLAQISTEMKNLKIKSERSLKTPLRVRSKHTYKATNEVCQHTLSHMEVELDNGQAAEQAPVAFHVEKVKSKIYKKEGFAASIKPRDSLEHIDLAKKRRNTLQRSHAQRKKFERKHENQTEAKENVTKQSKYWEKLHTSLSKLCDEKRVYEKRSVHSYTSARSIEPFTNVTNKPKTKAKRSASVKVPKSNCKHYRNKNLLQRRRKATSKYRTNSRVCHSELYVLSAQNSLELLRQRQRSDKCLPVHTATNSCVKFSGMLNSRAASKTDRSTCTTVSKTSLNQMADDVPSTSKAAVKSCALVQDFKTTYSNSDNETRCEPSTSSLEDMLVHIKTQLKQRHNKKHAISDKPSNSCTQQIRLPQQNAKEAGKSNKAKRQTTSRKRIVKPELPAAKKSSKARKRHKHRPLAADSVCIPLVRNNAYILGQQNRCNEIAYAIGAHSLYIKSMENLTPPTTQAHSRRRRKLKRKSLNVVQESEA